MIELVQFPWSPFCLVQRRILEFGGVPFKTTDIPSTDRSLVWQATDGAAYAVPLIRDGAKAVFETGENTQSIAQYLDAKFSLGLFPAQWAGVQDILWRHIENEIEGLTFRLSDIYWEERVPKSEACAFLRHKERKFGRGCIDRWRADEKAMLQKLAETLEDFERMLETRPFLLDHRPRFVDFDLWGMLAELEVVGHHALPKKHKRLSRWYRSLSTIQLTDVSA
jgi:glutathione S-transferase